MKKTKKNMVEVTMLEETKQKPQKVNVIIKETKQKLKDLKPVLKELHAETEKKSARMPENKMGYMEVYKSNPDVQNFLEVKRKLEEMIEIANSL